MCKPDGYLYLFKAVATFLEIFCKSKTVLFYVQQGLMTFQAPYGHVTSANKSHFNDILGVFHNHNPSNLDSSDQQIRRITVVKCLLLYNI